MPRGRCVNGASRDLVKIVQSRKRPVWPCPPDGVIRVHDAWRWRNAIVSADGPQDPITRHVLLTMSLRMNRDGTGCFAGVRHLAQLTRRSKDTVAKHRRAAVVLGFVLPPAADPGAPRQEWLPCLPPALSKRLGQCDTSSVRNEKCQCPTGSDLPATTIWFREGEHGF